METEAPCYAWRRTAGAAPDAVKAARPVLNGGREETCRKVTRLAPTQHQDDNVLDILVQSRRNKKAAKKCFKKLLKGLPYVPRVLITDQLRSYSAAKREVMPGVEHRQSRYLNNRCENSHRPTRQRERRMQGFKSPGHAQRFLSAYGPIAQHFRPRRHLLSASAYRHEMGHRFASWAEITGTERAA
jgi:putative transposase